MHSLYVEGQRPLRAQVSRQYLFAVYRCCATCRLSQRMAVRSGCWFWATFPPAVYTVSSHQQWPVKKHATYRNITECPACE